jgi:hypothetical protein
VGAAVGAPLMVTTDKLPMPLGLCGVSAAKQPAQPLLSVAVIVCLHEGAEIVAQKAASIAEKLVVSM